MSDNGGVLRGFSWRDCCPWLIILRSFRIAISPSVLVLATIGTLLAPIGWWLGWLIFFQADVDQKHLAQSFGQCPCTVNPFLSSNTLQGSGPADAVLSLPGANLARHWYHQLVEPFVTLFDSDLSLGHLAFFLFGGLWTLAVWAFFGGAITRIAAMQLGREEGIGAKDATRHVCRKYLSYLCAPLFPLGGAVLVGLPIATLGLFMIFDWGVVVGGIFWILASLNGFIMAVMLLGLLFGWPLMWATISTEGSDAFDGLSRSYAYVFGKPLHYLFYAAVASLFGFLCYVLVVLFSEAVISLTFWSASWGTNVPDAYHQVFAEESDPSDHPGGEPVATGTESRMDKLIQAVEHLATGTNANSTSPTEADETTSSVEGPGGALGLGARLIFYLNSLVRTVANAFPFSFFWCAVIAIYLLLRRDVDQTEFDEVWVEDEEQAYGLPAKPSEVIGTQSDQVSGGDSDSESNDVSADNPTSDGED